MPYVFQLTTRAPQFKDQPAQQGQLGAYYREEYPSLVAALCACENQAYVRLWAYERGIKTGGEMLASKG